MQASQQFLKRDMAVVIRGCSLSNSAMLSPHWNVLSPRRQTTSIARDTRIHVGNNLNSSMPVSGRQCVTKGSAILSDLENSPPEIDLIVTDVDGTLLNHNQELTLRVESAVKAAEKVGIPTIVATGKAIGPWTGQILPRLPTKIPQIFLQGLLIRDCHDGEVIYSRLLEHDVIRDCIEFAENYNLSLTAYCGERIICHTRDEHTDRLIFYGEPVPEALGPLEKFIGQLPIYKIILMQEEKRIDEIRYHAEEKFELTSRASLTTAIPGMLEILPPGASKGHGVKWTLDQLGVDPRRCMALGDGENDIEMLELVGLGIAVGNAREIVKQAANVVLEETNDQDAIAVAIEEFVLKPRGLSHDIMKKSMKL